MPLNLQILCLLDYSPPSLGDRYQEFHEERALATLLKKRAPVSLKEVVVPSQIINLGGSLEYTDEQLELWSSARKLLSEHEVFKDGTVKLRLLKRGEGGEFRAGLSLAAYRDGLEDSTGSEDFDEFREFVELTTDSSFALSP